LNAISIQLEFVNPVVASGWIGTRLGELRRNETRELFRGSSFHRRRERRL